jgi:hypothetical protein
MSKARDFREGIVKSFFESQVTGVVTMNHWSMASDGNEYQRYFCKTWTILTDKTIQKSLEGFINSSEKWSLVAIGDDGKVKALFPGCQVKGFFTVNKNPRERSCFTIK